MPHRVSRQGNCKEIRLTPESHYKPIFVARQPIFDSKESIWGYELLFRPGEFHQQADIEDGNIASAKVIADGFVIAMEGLDNTKKLFINFPHDLLMTGANLALPSNNCVIEILETVQPTDEIIAACLKIKAQGYLLAVDDFVGQKGFEPFLEIADIVKVDVFGQPPPAVIKLAQYLQHYPCKLLAEKVEDAATYHLTKSLGFSLFQGYLFSKPEMMKGRKISTEKISKIQLLQRLSDENYKVKELAKIIATDISLSYRLLKYLNSAFFAFQKKVKSINQAITILGSNHLRQWLAVVILSDLDHTDRASELVFTSVRRACFLETLARESKQPPHSPETMFLLGLFSMLDALLGLSMKQVMEKMPLEDEIKSAFLGTTSKAAEWLQIAVSLDFAEWQSLNVLLAKHRLAPKNVAILFNKASNWANHLLTA